MISALKPLTTLHARLLHHPRFLLYSAAAMLILTAAALLLVMRNAEQVPPPDPPPGYRLVNPEVLSHLDPQMYWLGEEVAGQDLLLVGLAVETDQDSSAQNLADDKATVYYGERGEIRSLALFLRAGSSAKFVAEQATACRDENCPSGLEPLELDDGFAAVRVFPTGAWEAFVLAGDSPLYVVSDLPNLTVEEALSQLEPVPAGE